MTDETVLWLSIGFMGQAMFSMRFLVQWLQSERVRRSVVPVLFWYFSIGGGRPCWLTPSTGRTRFLFSANRRG